MQLIAQVQDFIKRVLSVNLVEQAVILALDPHYVEAAIKDLLSILQLEHANVKILEN